jgi:pimeloyl-ACP methyl ester carboxylesterase
MRIGRIALMLLTAIFYAPEESKAVDAAAQFETGEIDGAKFAIARPPREWNRQLLLVAHGYRPVDKPLTADLEIDRLSQRALLDDGWMIAVTSFRRNGVIVADAIADLDALRSHVAQKFGTPARVIVEGDSMGGFIATVIAERPPVDPPLYDGVVAIGAALDTKELGADTGLSLQPRIPIVFLSNQSEFEGPKNYTTPKLPPSKDGVRPILFRVGRDGHVNVNQRERLSAIRALNLWLDRGRETVPGAASGTFFDATIAPLPQPSNVTLHADRRGFDARVTEINSVYGNVVLDAQPTDFAAVGIGKMARFQLSAHDKSFRVLLGRDFTGVKRGEWVVFPDAEGFVLLSRSFADAAAAAKLEVGDVIRIRRYGGEVEVAPER